MAWIKDISPLIVYFFMQSNFMNMQNTYYIAEDINLTMCKIVVALLLASVFWAVKRILFLKKKTCYDKMRRLNNNIHLDDGCITAKVSYKIVQLAAI